MSWRSNLDERVDDARERRKRVWTAWLSGERQCDIAERENVSPATICQDLKACREMRSDEAKEAIELDRSRVVQGNWAIIAAHWEQRHLPANAKAIQDSYKLIVAIDGLEAPKRTEVTLTGADLPKLTDEQLERVARGLPPGDPGAGGAGTSPTKA